jgi:SAM-dependent methyltransferase
MGLIAGIRPHHVVLDPMCGVGTIPIETMSFDPAAMWALDLNSQALCGALRNVEASGVDVRILQGDATQLPFPDGSVDRVVSNLPWGRQTPPSNRLRTTYGAAISEFSRVLQEGGRLVVLTDRVGLLLKYAEGEHLRLAFARQLSLFGRHPTLCTMVKSVEPLDRTYPFGKDALGRGLNELVRTSLADNLGHPDFRIRLHAVEGCTRWPDPEIMDALEERLHDEDGRVRSAASRALSRLNNTPTRRPRPTSGRPSVSSRSSRQYFFQS